MIFLTLLVIPLLIAIVSFIFLKTINLQEFIIQCIAQAIVAGVSVFIVSYVDTSDIEIQGGVVIQKLRDTVSCSHSYECLCTYHESCSGSGKTRTCTTVRSCQTCYEHTHDYDWVVKTSIGEQIEIRRIDRQGVHEPPRWSSVNIGDPIAVKNSYTNYVKASPDSLFRRHFDPKIKVPMYPDVIYDYYHINRFVNFGGDVNKEITSRFNNELMKLNGRIGLVYQVSTAIVVTDKPHDWVYDLEAAWLGGKKNDVILIVGVDAQLKPKWAHVFAWTQDKVLEVKLRDLVMTQQMLDVDTTIHNVELSIQRYYKRRPMKDFEYLKSSITPTMTEYCISIFVGILIALGLTYFFHKNDINVFK